MEKADFSINACYESVQFSVEELHEDPLKLLGRYVLRAQTDIFFNKTMIDACIKYLNDHNISWNQR